MYRKDLDKHVKGHGLSTDQTPQLQHAKDMLIMQSEVYLLTEIEVEVLWLIFALHAKFCYDPIFDYFILQWF